jgi:hypothetical protein
LKEIELNRKHQDAVSGLYTLVDDEDFDFLNQWNWSFTVDKSTKNIRVMRNIYKDGKATTITMSRLLMKAKNYSETILFKDGNGLNNQKSNLILCTRSQMVITNKKPYGLSKYFGVHKLKRYNGWCAGIKYDGVYHPLGYSFTTEVEAAKAYNKAAIDHYGAFARLNKFK